MIAALNRLEACHRRLISALDASDVEAIMESVGEFREAVEEIRSIGIWKETPKVAEVVGNIRRLSDAARIRVNFLTDLNRQRIDVLAAARGRAFAGTYRSDGSRAA